MKKVTVFFVNVVNPYIEHKEIYDFVHRKSLMPSLKNKWVEGTLKIYWF